VKRPVAEATRSGSAVDELGAAAPASCQLTGVERLGGGPRRAAALKAGDDAVREGKGRSARHRRPLSTELSSVN
jgi:hypothetical protein